MFRRKFSEKDLKMEHTSEKVDAKFCSWRICSMGKVHRSTQTSRLESKFMFIARKLYYKITTSDRMDGEKFEAIENETWHKYYLHWERHEQIITNFHDHFWCQQN